MADKVVLVRHGIAEDRFGLVPDSKRQLTGWGREILEREYPKVFPSLTEGYAVESIVVLASATERTVQTAEVICDILGKPRESIRQSMALTRQDIDTISDEIRETDGTVIAVGHSPSIDEVASRMSGRMRLMLRGEALCIDMTGGGRATVMWDMCPR